MSGSTTNHNSHDSSSCGRPAPTSARQLLRQQRELEEKRRYGLAPLALDAITQAEISPNVPQSIAKAPWYYGATGPTLDHQRKQQQGSTTVNTIAEEDKIQENDDRVVFVGQATRFTAGACKNCGSRTHKAAACTQAKKRVGAKYSNVVTGADLVVQRAQRLDGQKRDRFVGDIGVDLLQGHMDNNSSGDDDDDKDDGEKIDRKKFRPENVFATRTAQHGGVEIQELPKYLQNLDQQDDGESSGGIYYDPKTGSMRGNPNVHDPTRAFQGDLERYRTGDFYNYVEAQHRYLTGQSKSFVDFGLDRELNAEKGIAIAAEATATTTTEGSGGGSSNPTNANTAAAVAVAVGLESASDALVRALYGATAASASVTAFPGPSTVPAPAAAAASAPSDAIHTRLMSLSAAALTLSSSSPNAPTTSTADGAASSSGKHHRCVYGSYLDTATMQWGYACCREMGRDAAGCTAP